MTTPIEPGRKTVPIRWRDLDGFNHVNNAVYLNYLEEGRDAWLANALGEGITQLTEFVVRRRVELIEGVAGGGGLAAGGVLPFGGDIH